jgi:enoyl-CoA hydratase
MEIEQQGEIAVIQMRAGKANAMDETFLRRLEQLFDRLVASPARAAVLTGYDSFFSAGLALPSLVGMGREQLRSFVGLFESTMRGVFGCPLPVVAAVNGHAIAGGCILALQCDVRLMADGEAKVGLNEVQLGIGLPSAAMTPVRLALPASSIPAVVMEGRLFSAREAKDLGLVNELVAPAELIGRAVERARALTAGTREAVAEIKRTLRGEAMEVMEQRGAEELESWLDTWFSAAAQERIAKAVARIRGGPERGR